MKVGEFKNFEEQLVKLLVAAFEEIDNHNIKHTTFDENTTDEELCNKLCIDVEEFKSRRTEDHRMEKINMKKEVNAISDEILEHLESLGYFEFKEDETMMIFEFEEISDNMVNIISEHSPEIKIAKKYKTMTVFPETKNPA